MWLVLTLAVMRPL